LVEAVLALPSVPDHDLLRYLDERSAERSRCDLGAATVRQRTKRGLERLREALDASHGDRRSWIAALGCRFPSRRRCRRRRRRREPASPAAPPIPPLVSPANLGALGMAASTRTIPSLLVAGVVLGLLGVGTWVGVRLGSGREEAPTPVPTSAEEDAARAGLAGAGRREGAPPTVAPTTPAAVIARGSARVTGEVRLAADGRPAAGPVVRAVRDGEEVARATVGAAGTFALTGLAADGSTTVEASREGHATARLAGLALVDGATRDVGTLWLDAAIRVEVRVVGAAGQPVRDAKVRAFRTRTAVAPEDWAGRADRRSPARPARTASRASTTSPRTRGRSARRRPGSARAGRAS
jgi:hypothetical protein